MSKKMVTPRYGEPFEVDTSDEACRKFGFKHGDRVVHPHTGPGTVIGVAPATEGLDPEPDVLWYASDYDKRDVVSYSHPSLLKPAQ